MIKALRSWMGPAVATAVLLGLCSKGDTSDFTAGDAIGIRLKGNMEKGGIEMMAANIQDGMGWYAASSNAHIYCQPPRLALNGSQIMDMVQLQVSEHPNFASLPLGLVIIQALKETFPCSPSPK